MPFLKLELLAALLTLADKQFLASSDMPSKKASQILASQIVASEYGLFSCGLMTPKESTRL